MEYDNKNMEFNLNQDNDYYRDKLNDHNFNLSHNRQSPLLDFDNEGEYYKDEPYSKIKNTNSNINNNIHSIIKEKDPVDHIKGDFRRMNESGGDTGNELIHLDALRDKFKDLIYWKDIRITGAIFALFLVILFTLTHYSIISVLAYVGLALLSCSVGYYLYQNLMQTLNKSKQGHVFRQYLDQDVVISPETGNRLSKKVIKQLNYLIRQAKHIFLVEDVMDTVKFGFVLWAMTYIGAYFNGLTLFVLMFVSLFTIPKIYSTYRVQINDAASRAKVVLDKNKDIAMKTIQDKAQIVKDKVSKMKKP